MKVTIIGQGYVGLPLAISISGAGHEVLGFDLKLETVENLNKGVSHVEDISNQLLLEAVRTGRYRASSDQLELASAEVAIIAVPTPLDKNRLPDLSFVESASEILGRNLGNSALIINGFIYFFP